MKKEVFLIVLFLILICKNSIADFNNNFDDFNNSDVVIRIGALIKLNDALEKGKLHVTDQIKDVAHKLTAEKVNGSYKYTHDDEGQYELELESLAVKINDQQIIPYLFSCMSSRAAREALTQQGQPAFEYLLKINENLQLLKSDDKRSTLEILKLMAVSKNKYYLQNSVHTKIKDNVLKILNSNDYPDRGSVKDEKKYQRKMYLVAIYIKKPALDALVALGDRDMIPLIENMANNDKGYEEVHQDDLKYKRMSFSERKEHMGEIQKMMGERKAKIEAAGGKEPDDLVKYYPIREEAKKALEELKRKNKATTCGG